MKTVYEILTTDIERLESLHFVSAPSYYENEAHIAALKIARDNLTVELAEKQFDIPSLS